jgi:hypothetical protein
VHERRIQEAVALLQEHAGPPDVDAARALNGALSTVVAGLWAQIDEDCDRLLVEFEMVGAVHRGDPLPTDRPIMFGRPTLPPRRLDDRGEPEPLRTEPSASPPSR